MDSTNSTAPSDGPTWRVGGNYGIHAYAADEPWVADPTKDRPVGTFHRPDDAALAVAAVNVQAELRAETAALTAKVSELVQVAHELCAERDAARAELAAAHAHDTDGPDRQGLDDVHLLRCVVRDFGLITTEAVRLNARDALNRVLLRARLADEATADDKETKR